MSAIEQDVQEYEDWLKNQCDVVGPDLEAKHRRMRKKPFDFFRATYFRWSNTIEELCPALCTAPEALCVGDIHVENYGTWRDGDARLVWGVNDFDEAAVMPYAWDLVRLATSARLVPNLELDPGSVADAVLRGYQRGLDKPGAVLLDEGAGWLRSFGNPTNKSNAEFWQEVDEYPVAAPLPSVREALKRSLPDGAEVQRYVSRVKGGGSLGRPRFVVIATWQSGRVVREAKALVPSAWNWAHKIQKEHLLHKAANGRYRSPDPILQVVPGFVLRRVAPDSRKIELEDVSSQGMTEDLLTAMSAELAGIHAASCPIEMIRTDLKERSSHWLLDAAVAAEAATMKDFERYKKLAV